MSDVLRGGLLGELTTMVLNCDPVDGYPAGRVSGQPRTYHAEVYIPDFKMLQWFIYSSYNGGQFT